MKSLKYIFIISSFLIMGNNYAQEKHEMTSTTKINFEPKIPIKTIGIFIYDGYNTLDAIGPYHILSQIMGAKVFFVSQKQGMIKNQTGMEIKTDKGIDDIDSLDILIIPGGAKETYFMTKNQKVLDWIKKIDVNSVYTGSVCTGAWILGATGLLKNKNATTNWYKAEEMLSKYGANFKQERYVKDGKYWTSAGVTAGMDMSLAIINELFGRGYTEAVMLDLEYDPSPPFEAGTVKNTDPEVQKVMMKMYDDMFKSVMGN